MKVTEMIQQLENILEQHGDNSIEICVGDHYSVGGHRASIEIDTSGCMWTGVRSNGHTTILDVHIEQQTDCDTGDVKFPKVTFRK
jgi:hypothetical protein